MKLQYANHMKEAAIMVRAVKNHLNAKGIMLWELAMFLNFLDEGTGLKKRISGSIEVRVGLETIADGILTNDYITFLLKAQELMLINYVHTKLQGQPETINKWSLADAPEGEEGTYMAKATTVFKRLLAAKDVTVHVSIPKFSVTKVSNAAFDTVKEMVKTEAE